MSTRARQSSKRLTNQALGNIKLWEFYGISLVKFMPLIFPIVFLFTAFNLFDRLIAYFGSRTHIGDRLSPKGAQDRLGLFLDRFERLKEDIAVYMSTSDNPDFIHMDPTDSQVTDEEAKKVAHPDSVDMQLISERL